jgi:4-amino-4-deoxy-L-arabinose transferase-like glycosyltransferase
LLPPSSTRYNHALLGPMSAEFWRMPGLLGRSKRHRFLRLSILGYFVVFSGSMAFLVPLYEAPDEIAHLAYLDLIAQDGRLPRMRHAGPEGHQPPLYYALASLIPTLVAPVHCIHVNARYNPFHYHHGGTRKDVPEYESVLAPVFPTLRDAVAFYGVRLLSVAGGALAVLCVLDTAPLVLGGWPRPAIAALFMASLPEFAYISSVVNNDSLANLLGALTIWAAARIARRPQNRLSYVALGLALGLGILTKKNLLCFLPGLAFLLGYVFWVNSAVRSQICKSTALCVLAAICAGGPGLVRNFLLYGDILGARVEGRMMQGIRDEKPFTSNYFWGSLWTDARGTVPRDLVTWTVIATALGVVALCAWFYRGRRLLRLQSAVLLFVGAAALGVIVLFPLRCFEGRSLSGQVLGPYWELVYISFIGQFGHFNLPLPTWIHRGYALLFTLAGVGLLASLKPRDIHNATTFTLALVVLTFGAGLTYYNMTYSQAHGRLLFPALPAIAILCGQGWDACLARLRGGLSRSAVIVAVVAFMLSADAVTLWRMYWYWYDPHQYLG